MAGWWNTDELVAVSGEPEHRLSWYADSGLLHRQPTGEFDTDSLHRIRMIQYVRRRGGTDEQLAAVTASQGDLLGIFTELSPADEKTYDLREAAKELGIDDDLTADLAEVLNWEDVEAGTEEDVDALRLLATALSLGLPRDALLQLIRVFTDVMDRLADTQTRIFHDHVHDRFRAQGLSGRELLETTHRVAKPMQELVEPAAEAVKLIKAG